MPTKTFSTFYIHDQLFGLDILLISEINKQLELTPVPQAPEYIRGLVNLRGQIVTLIDLKKRLGLGLSKLSSKNHNVILKTDSELLSVRQFNQETELKTVSDKVGIIVDEIDDVISVDASQIDLPTLNNTNVESAYIEGVVKLDKSLLAILSSTKILSHT